MDHSRYQQQQTTSGLSRYRSAPSSYFASLLNTTPAGVTTGGVGGCGYARDDVDHLLNARSSGTDIQQVFARFVASIDAQDSISNDLGNTQQNPSSSMNVRSEFIAPIKQENEAAPMNYQCQAQQSHNSQFIPPVKQEHQSSDYSSVSQMNYQTRAQQNDNSSATTSALDNSYRFISSVTSDGLKMGGGVGAGGSNSNLARYNSSPAGFFAQINIENDFGAMGSIRSYGTGSNAAAEASFSTPSRFSSQIGFPSGQPTPPSRLMTPISEIGARGLEESSTGDGSFGEGHGNDEIPGFAVPTWDDSLILSDDFLQVPEDNESEPFSNIDASVNQSSEGRSRPPTVLSHHLSLPKSTAELSAVEKLLQDSVPCKVRAKRGFATHPRSIAERVRRTRISDRMRKLQELVPNMDKQTNTSDMLDLAVEYIKDLAEQVKILAERRDKCTCKNV